MKNLLYVILLFTGLTASAQETYSINGTVNDEKGMTVPGATVFITNSKFVTATNTEGKFNFDNIHPGTYAVVIKMLGFDPVIQSVTVKEKSVKIIAYLTESVTALNTVNITAKATAVSNANREKYLALFTKYFIGETINAKQCKLLNPQVLNFHYDENASTLTANASELLVIENNALGYTLKYLLTGFKIDLKNYTCINTGYPYFEELKGTAAQQKQWEENRKLAYLGSARHFFRAVMNNTAQAEGFIVYQITNNVKTINNTPKNKQFTIYQDTNNTTRENNGKRQFAIYQNANRTTQVNNVALEKITAVRVSNINSLFTDYNKGFKALIPNERDSSGTEGLFIVYTGADEPALFYHTGTPIDLPIKLSSRKRQISKLLLLGDTLVIDKNGGITPVEGFRYFGYWAWQRIADLTPLDYFVAGPPAAAGKVKDMIVALDTFRNKVPIEKVHIQTDKPYYSIGDTIWMKAYVVNEDNELSDLSKTVYVDLVNDRDSVKVGLRLPLTQGLGWGAITLRDSLRAGNYHIKAYTNNMRNFGEDYYFDKFIKIGNALPPVTGGTASAKIKPVKNIVQTAVIKTDSVSVKFFPEGGDLVNGITSRMAFKAIGSDGLSREISGIIKDKGNKPVAAFRSEHAGMGAFLLQPVLGDTYTAVIKLPDSSLKRVALPPAKEQGYTLSVNQNADNVFVSISASRGLLKSGEVSLVAQAGNAVEYSGKSDLAHGGSTTIIPKSHFTEGIVQFTLFSPQFEPVAERLVFIRDANDHLKIKVTPDKPDYGPRDKVHLNLEVTNQDGKPVMGSFSMAVTDENKVPFNEADETTIFSNLLLTSDLKGYIEHPNYYFTDVNEVKDEQLDNLLLTQGWRRFVWQDILNNKLPSLAYQPEMDTGISGRLLEKGKPAPNAKVHILLNEGKGGLLDTVTDADGRFNFNNLTLASGVKFNVAATNAAGKQNVTVAIDKEQNNQPLTFKPVLDEQPLNENFTAYLDNSSKRFEEMKKYALLNNTMLKEVDINAAAKPMTAKQAALQFSKNRSGPADQVLTFVDLADCNTLVGCIPGKLNGIQVRIVSPPGQPPYFVAIYEGHQLPVIIDGHASSSQILSGISPDQIAAIEVIKGARAGIDHIPGTPPMNNGILYVTLKQAGVDYESYIEEHDRQGHTQPRGLQTYIFKNGYALRREFYSPDYDNPATNKQMADLRTTIYWAPNIITDKGGKASVSFFNADSEGSYRIITEGLDGQGKLGREVDRYTVK